MPIMELRTWHESDFSLTSGTVDHARSEYYSNVRGVPDAYAELATRLGTDQVVWCYVRPGEYLNGPHLTRVEWVLEVPDDKILAIVDAFIWNKILGIKTFPRGLYRDWLDDARAQRANIDEYVQSRMEDYHSQPEPTRGWWSALCITDTTAEGATVLLRHPVPRSWVLRDGRASE